GPPLGQHRVLGGDREVDLAGGGQLLGDLKARVAAPDHQHRPGRGGVGGGGVWGWRQAALCSWVTEASSLAAWGGTKGTWNGPVATTTWRARKTSSAGGGTSQLPAFR